MPKYLIDFSTGLSTSHIAHPVDPAYGIVGDGPYTIIQLVRIPPDGKNGSDIPYLHSTGGTNDSENLYMFEDGASGAGELRVVHYTSSYTYTSQTIDDDSSLYAIAYGRSSDGNTFVKSVKRGGAVQVDYGGINTGDFGLSSHIQGNRKGDLARKWKQQLGGLYKLDREITNAELADFIDSGDIFSAIGANRYVPSSWPSELKLAFLFEEGTGTTVTDEISGSIQATLTNTAGDDSEWVEATEYSVSGITVNGVDNDVDVGSSTVESYTSSFTEVHIVNLQQDASSEGYNQFNSFFSMSGVVGEAVNVYHQIDRLWGSVDHPFVWSYSGDPDDWHPFDNREVLATEVRHWNDTAFTQDKVYVARAPTFTHKVIDTLVTAWKASPLTKPSSASDSDFVAGVTTERTAPGTGRVAPAGLKLYEFMIDDEARAPASRLHKLIVHLQAGNHPTEESSYQQLYHTVEWLLAATDPLAQHLLSECIFIVRPSLLPAGAYCGYYRSDVPETGAEDCTPFNSNRYWGDGLAGTVPIPTVLQWLEIFPKTFGGRCDISLDYHTTPSLQKTLFLKETAMIPGAETTFLNAIQSFGNSYDYTWSTASGGDGDTFSIIAWEQRQPTFTGTPEFGIGYAYDVPGVQDFAIALMKAMSKMISDGWFDANLRYVRTLMAMNVQGVPDGTYETHLLDDSGTVIYHGDLPFAGSQATAVLPHHVSPGDPVKGFVIDNQAPHVSGAVIAGDAS